MRGADENGGSSSSGPGTVIAGRYRLQRMLGRGGMGVVWEALDTRLNRKVAVKGLLYPGASGGEAQAKWASRARREAQAIARIEHQNVVAVHDVIEGDDQVWIVMELLNSRSLADLLREQQQLSVPHAARIGLQVLRGLAAAHAAGVLHRDVKPHNILFRSDGRALLMDFGIATFEGATQVTRPHEIIGTPHYLAPELLSRSAEHPSPATAASDLWALGVTLYEMVEGRRPFEGADAYGIMIAVLEAPLPPMRFGGPLTPLVEALLQKDPQQRPDAREVEWMFQDIARELPALDTPSAPSAPSAPNTPSAPSTPGPRKPPEPTEPEADRSPRPVTGPGPGEPARAGEGKGRGRWKIPVAAVCAVLLAGGGWFVWGQGDDTKDGNSAAAAPKPDHAEKNLFKHDHPVLVIGVKDDQHGLGEEVKKGKYKGFEVDLGNEIATRLGYDPDTEVKFETVKTFNRADQLLKGRVHIVLATYSLQKNEGIEFAGPYFEPLGGILVKEKNQAHIDDMSKLEGQKNLAVCTAKGSVYTGTIKKFHMTVANPLPQDYESCFENLMDPKSDVYAVMTDDVIVQGYELTKPGTKALDSFPGNAAGYGVAMKEDNGSLKREVCDALKAIMHKPDNGTSEWEKLYDKNLKEQMGGGPAPSQPALTECNER